MIGRLNGIILEKKPPLLIIEVNGIGYEVFAPMTTFYHLPECNQAITLHTHFVVREDAHQLYGFLQQRERDLFRALIKINGVGPKLALSILSSMPSNDFIHCIQANDTTQLTRIPGIGKKTAERLIIETRDALAQWDNSASITSPAKSQDNNTDQQIQDAISALISLGYSNTDAKRSVEAIYQLDLSREELIRLALQQKARG